jgi:hypothetical protein
MIQFAKQEAEMSGIEVAFTVAVSPVLFPFFIQGALDASRRGKIGLYKVDSRIADELNLPPGHPSENEAYVRHPVDEYTYCPFKDYHRWAFEDKFAELVRLLQSLGAKRIEVEHDHGWNRDIAAKIDTDISYVEGPELENGSTQSSSVLFRGDYPGHTDPELPDDLIWYEYEPIWQAVAKGRIEEGLETFSFTLEYTDDFGVNADLAARVAKYGLSVGGTFTEHKKTVWKVKGAFKDRLFSRFFSFG